MEFTSSLLTHNQEYVLLLAAVMALSFVAKKTQVFLPFYSWIAKSVKSKRAVVALISVFSGVLPISGRVAISAGTLDTIAPRNEKRKTFGIIDYLSTHHFYFWSPLEATVLVPMATLNISYATFIGKIWPLLVTAIVVILFYIFKVLKEEDVDIVIPDGKIKKKDLTEFERKAELRRDRAQIIDYAKTLVFVSLVIIAGNIVKANFDSIKAWVERAHSHNLLLLVVLVGFLASLSLGSSGKFAGFTALSASVFGVETLPLFFAVDYAGYMLSPMHKCLVVGKSYFHTPFKEYYKAILTLVVPLILMGTLMYLGALDL